MDTTAPHHTLTLNDHHTVIHTVTDLHAQCAQVSTQQWVELWLHCPSGQWLGVLVHADRAFLIYGRWTGDPGWHARAAPAPAEPEAPVTFRLANGQQEVYPASWTVRTADALVAVVHLFTHGEPAAWITWHDDSVA